MFITNAGKDSEGAYVISDYVIGIDRSLNARGAYLLLKDVSVIVGSGTWGQYNRQSQIGASVFTVKDGKFAVAP